LSFRERRSWFFFIGPSVVQTPFHNHRAWHQSVTAGEGMPREDRTHQGSRGPSSLVRSSPLARRRRNDGAGLGTRVALDDNDVVAGSCRMKCCSDPASGLHVASAARTTTVWRVTAVPAAAGACGRSLNPGAAQEVVVRWPPGQRTMNDAQCIRRFPPNKWSRDRPAKQGVP
jgi:hypothetical protein